jgi:hypothetical protein
MKDLRYFEKIASSARRVRAHEVANAATHQRRADGPSGGCSDAFAVYAALSIDIVAACRFASAGAKSTFHENRSAPWD